MATGYSGSINLGSDSFRGSFTMGSDEIFDFRCTPCENRNNLQVQAENYCSDCDEFCCQPCEDVHNSFKVNRSHKVYTRDEIDKWGQQDGGAQVPLEICPDHPGEIIEMICLNDNVLCCRVCEAASHRTCPGITYIPKIAKGVKDSPDLSIVDITIDQCMKLVNEMIKSDEKAETSLDKSKIDYLQTIKHVKQKIDDFFSNLEKKASTKMDKFHAETKKGINNHKKALDATKDKLTQHHNAIQSSRTNNESQLFINMFEAQNILPELKHDIEKLAQTPHTSSFHLVEDKSLQKMFYYVESLGEIKDDATIVQRDIPNINPLPLLSQKQLIPPALPPRLLRQQQLPLPTTTITATSSRASALQQYQLYKAKNVFGREINVEMKSDECVCSMEGSCQMPNGQIILTDFDNFKVKLLNEQYHPTDYAELPASPNAICSIRYTEAAVTCNNNTIHFLSITERKISVTKVIMLDHVCFGIAYNSNYGQLFVSDYKNKVYIHTTSGECLRTIQRDKNGIDMFSKTRHICVSPDVNKVYVADYDKGLVTLDSEGNYLSRYNSEDLENAFGVCVESQGSVLVCGAGSHNVLQLDEGGTKKVGEVVGVLHIIDSPTAICIDKHNCKLIVCMRLSNNLNVFDLM